MKRSMLVALLLFILLGLFAWSGTEGTLPEEPKVIPAEQFPDGYGSRGGTLIIDLRDDPRTFNPIVEFGSSSYAVNSLIHGTLLEMIPLPEGKALLVPGLAKAFEVLSDLRTIKLYLRKGLKFSDGHPLTADDVLFTFNDVVFNPDVGGRKSLWQVKGNGELKFPTVEKIDNYTVQIETPILAPQILGNLANQVVLPEHLLAGKVHKLNPDVSPGSFNDAWGINTPPEQIAGTGPFRLKSYITGDKVVLERNPYYWKVDPRGVQLPYLDEIIMPIVPDDKVRMERFINGNTDIYRPIPDDLASIPPEYKGILEPETVGDSVFVFNQDADNEDLKSLFREPKFREAMSYTVDRQAIIDNVWLKLAEPRCSPGVARAFWIGGDILNDPENFPWCHFNLDRAAELLGELGLNDIDGDGIREFPDGQIVSFELLVLAGARVPHYEADLFAADLRKIGIKVSVHQVSFPVLIERLFSSNYEVARIGLSGGGDPNFIADIYTSCGSLHFYRFSDCEDGQPSPDEGWQKEVDELFAQQASEVDPEKRAEIIKNLQRIIAKNLPFIWTVKGSKLCAARFDRIANFECSSLLGDSTILNSEIIYRKD